jgi:hypothetical protein
MPAPDGSTFNGEEVMLLGLYRLKTTGILTDSAYKDIFGLEQDVVSKQFKCFVELNF